MNAVKRHIPKNTEREFRKTSEELDPKRGCKVSSAGLEGLRREQSRNLPKGKRERRDRKAEGTAETGLESRE